MRTGTDLLNKIDANLYDKNNDKSTSLGFIFQAKLNKKNEFFIRHYAGIVNYKVDDLVTKNNDYIPDDLIVFLLKNQQNFLVKHVLKNYLDNKEHKKKLTVLSKFQKNLNDLIGILCKTNVMYIRCIKPNRSLETTRVFDCDLTRSQLESCGVRTVLNIHKIGLTHKFEFKEFGTKFRPILMWHLGKKNPAEFNDAANKNIAKKILNTCLNDLNSTRSKDVKYKFGIKKLFLNDFLLDKLICLQERIKHESALKIQRFYRDYKLRKKKHLSREKSAARLIQNWWLNSKRADKLIENDSHRAASSRKVIRFNFHFDVKIVRI
jgi:myosin heavy subunit